MKTTGDYDLQIYAMVQDIDQLLFNSRRNWKNSRNNEN